MDIRKTAWFLTLAGAIPFAVCTILLQLLPEADPAFAQTALAMMVYGAVILSFLGGIRWGLALVDYDSAKGWVLVLSVLPSLTGWASVFFPMAFGFGLLLIAFLAQLVWDRAAVSKQIIPEWFGKLRVVITTIVGICLLNAVLATV